MSITESIELLKAYNGPLALTLHKGANEELISKIESTYGITLPTDFKILYRFSDGFETEEDMFNIIPLAEIIDNKNRNNSDPLYIAEYMIYSDMWLLEINPDDCNDYKIVIRSNCHKLVLTKSLSEFIERFIKGGVFEPGGLYDWQEGVESQSIYPTKLKTAELLLTFFYYGLRYDIVSKKEVVDWADRLVMHEDEPETFFIELSLSHDKNELISLLNSVCVAENRAVARAVLGLLYHQLSGGVIKVDKAIAIMDTHGFWKLLTRLETAHIYNFTDEIWMGGLAIDDNELRQNVLNFLAYYKEFEIANYKYWFGISQRIEYQLSSEEEGSSAVYQAPKNKLKIELWMIYALVYALALISSIVLVTTYPQVEDKIPLNKFRGDLYQLSALYFSLFICYYILKSGRWLVKKLAASLKVFR